ncbi:hypothetical protein [Streptomyces bottropensis]|uniref:hypothetical protein n=1 Tax=Streptomyces bottropensis TaxID=42235 RepID=UPI0036A28DB1
MAVVLTFSWPEITADVYDAVRKKVRREEDAPDGCVLHAAWFVDGSLNVMDIWESEDHSTGSSKPGSLPHPRANWACKAIPTEVPPPAPALRRPRGQRRQLLRYALRVKGHGSNTSSAFAPQNRTNTTATATATVVSDSDGDTSRCAR